MGSFRIFQSELRLYERRVWGFLHIPPKRYIPEKRLTHLRGLEAASIVEESLLYQCFQASY